MRALIFGFIVCLVASSAFAQEGQRPAQKMPDEVTLFAVISTGKDKPDIKYHETMPKSMTRAEQIETCTKMAHEFLTHRFPEATDAKALVATCFVPLNIPESDT